jgi:hypothetical protein
MPTAKKITRKDDPNEVTMYAEGGRVPKPVESDYSMRVTGEGAANEYGSGFGGRASLTKKLGKDLDIEGYLEGYGSKSKRMGTKGEITGGGVKLTKRFAKGGESKVNEAGNYTKPGMRKRLFESIKAGGKGGAPGQWSGRKAQMLAVQYKKAGGGYRD